MSLSQRINDTNAAPWVIEEIKRLEVERDEAFAKGKQAFEDLRRVEAGRNALAAHVAACHALMEEMPRRSLAWQVNAMVDLKAEAPEASLARLKAEWQADALEQAADELCQNAGGEIDYSDVLDKAAELRRQAEEGV